jgi:transporter family protein
MLSSTVRTWRTLTVKWLPFALASAGFAAVTAILAKLGTKDVPSNVATLFRTAVVLVFAAGIVAAKGELAAVWSIDRRGAGWLAASGIATGLSWLAYFRALELGPASRVAPIDKLSLALVPPLAFLFLGEEITPRLGLGVALIVAGALLTLK